MVLDAVESRFPATKEFIDDTLKEECEKAWKNIFVLNLYYSDYFFVYRCGNVWQIARRQNGYQNTK